MERRKRNRVELKLRCRVLPASRAEPASWRETRNISRTGMLLHWDNGVDSNVPSIGDPVSIELKLPANPLFGQRCMLFHATVVRVSKKREVAVHIQRSQLRPQATPVIFEVVALTWVN